MGIMSTPGTVGFDRPLGEMNLKVKPGKRRLYGKEKHIEGEAAKPGLRNPIYKTSVNAPLRADHFERNGKNEAEVAAKARLEGHFSSTQFASTAERNSFIVKARGQELAALNSERFLRGAAHGSLTGAQLGELSRINKRNMKTYGESVHPELSGNFSFKGIHPEIQSRVADATNRAKPKGFTGPRSQNDFDARVGRNDAGKPMNKVEIARQNTPAARVAAAKAARPGAAGTRSRAQAGLGRGGQARRVR